MSTATPISSTLASGSKSSVTPNSPIADNLRVGYCVNTNPLAPCTSPAGYTSWTTRNLTMSARSRHPGGVNTLLCDGRVRFVSSNVLSSMRAMAD